MRLRSLIITTVLTVTTLIAVAYADVVFAQVMQSTSYQIESDSINTGGGLASSTNYVIEDTVGEQATGQQDSTSYSIRSGYQQMQETYLAITAAADVTMSPSIGGVSGGNATGSTMVTITTDNRAGYQLSINASGSPAMQSGVNTIADYAPGADPEFVFTTGAGEAHFGFSPEGSHVTNRFKDNGTDTCNTDINETAERCWDGLSTTPALIAQSSSANHPSGTDTTVRFQVGVGAAVNQAPGTYVATTTLTLIAQ